MLTSFWTVDLTKEPAQLNDEYNETIKNFAINKYSRKCSKFIEKYSYFQNTRETYLIIFYVAKKICQAVFD